MNRRTLLGGLVGCLVALGCGGGMKPVTFAPDNQPLAKSASDAAGKKDMAAVKRCAEAAERRSDSNKMLSDEREAFKYVVSLCEKGEWDKAKTFLDNSLASGK